MSEILNGDFTKDEIAELHEFMLNHPYAKLIDWIQEKSEALDNTRERLLSRKFPYYSIYSNLLLS